VAAYAGVRQVPPSTGDTTVRRTRYVHPGQVFVSAEPTVLSTILGSCVAVCLWDARRRCGGMNHFLLPRQHSGQAPSTRYGDTALYVLLSRLLSLGCAAGDLQAKVFGGASVLPSLGAVAGRLGASNLELAHRLLTTLGIPVVAADEAGQAARRLIFQTDDGSAWVRTVSRIGND